MRWRILIAVGIALTMLPSTALASHMGNYRNNPVEHDLQGTINEPDGLSTSVLGPLVTNCVLDLPPFEGRCVADPVAKPSGAIGSVIAPGCTGAGGERRLAGQCGIWVVGWPISGPAAVPPGTVPPPVSEQGMPGNAAPGAYTPTKGDTIRFLDGQWTPITPQTAAGGAQQLEVNEHLRQLNRLLGTSALPADNILPYTNFWWPWYGEWTDRNGNGVIDHHTTGTAGPTPNEFAWLGGCMNFGNARTPQSIARGICIEDPNPNTDPPGQPCADTESVVACAGTTINIWFYPGNHNGWAPAGIPPPDDFPGQQAFIYALNLGECNAEPSCDEIDRDFFGDPLLGKQGEVTPDLEPYDDRTGDLTDTSRQWAGIRGWATTSYGDDGLLVTAVQVHGVNCRADQAHANRERLDTCTFVDVDRQTSIAPTVQELLVGGPEEYPNGGLKGSARGAWLVVRDSTGTETLQRRVDAVQNSRDLYLAQQGPLQGQVDDLSQAPGWSREPNHPSDSYVGVVYRACGALPVGDPRNPTSALDPEELEAQHRGWCNIDSDGRPAYSAYRDGARGFFDLQSVKSLGYQRPIALIPGQPCQLCTFGSLGSTGLYPEPNDVPPAVETHLRSLGPGQYVFQASFNTWQDMALNNDESLFPDPPETTFELYKADGWVGSVARDTGQWRYRGYADVECTTEQGLGLHSAAECNPYLDGNVENPQDFTLLENEGETVRSCANTGLAMSLAPVDGELDTQILVWREHQEGLEPDPLDLNGDGQAELLPPIEAYGPGPVAPLVMGGTCNNAATWTTNDFLIWLEGNRGDDILTALAGTIPLQYDRDGDGSPDFDSVFDADNYAAWGL